VDDDDGVLEIQRDDLELDAAVVLADPDGSGVGRSEAGT